MELWLILLVAAAGALLGFGFYRGWFATDKTKFKEDAKHVIDKF